MSSWIWNRNERDDLETQAKLAVNKFNAISDDQEKRFLLEEIQSLIHRSCFSSEFSTLIPSFFSFLKKNQDLGFFFLIILFKRE